MASLLHSLEPGSAHLSASQPPSKEPLLERLLEVFLATYDLGFVAFGGPPVHFQILRRRFVDGVSTRPRFFPGAHRSQQRFQPQSGAHSNVIEHLKWIDTQTYSELFAIVQALPGPGSTKMLAAIAGMHAGWIAALLVFIVWSLPGAIGMFALSVGVQRIGERLPSAVYALLSGLNASTVGIVAVAAIQLAEKAIVDKLSRILVLVGACAGICYNALWYFPVLIVCGGLVTALWDTWLRQQVERARLKWRKRKEQTHPDEARTEHEQSFELRSHEAQSDPQNGLSRRSGAPGDEAPGAPPTATKQAASSARLPPAAPQHENFAELAPYSVSIAAGIALIAFTLALLIALILSRTLLPSPPPRPLALFANMYLAGTIIFGGGPVVIPLLREFVVQPGWVNSRDFLIGLALIQAFPGPNFNFSVFLGALAMRGTPFPGILGAFLAYVGIFFPGLAFTFGIQGLWRVLRTKPLFVSLLRGINATAVGLVFTAVYRLWEIGYLTPEASQGQSLALEPWWVVVAAVTYAETAWFGIPAAAAIVVGAVLGLAWYGAVGE